MKKMTPLKLDSLELAETLEANFYTDSEIAKMEEEAIFRKVWQYVGHQNQFATQGQTRLQQHSKTPLILCKDAEKINAFANICIHRAGPICKNDGIHKTLQCRYHGWTYGLDGKLKVAPEMDDAQNYDFSSKKLFNFPLDAWESLLFTKYETNIKFPLDTMLKGISERIKPHNLNELQFSSRVSYDINCNWKTYVDNYMEGYHLPLVHPGLSKLLDYKAYTTELFDHYSLQFSPFKPGASIYSKDNGEAYYYFIFPNMMLNILPNRLQVNLIVPLDESNCQVIFDYYYTDLESEETKKLIIEDLAYSDEIQKEDIDICLRVQKNLATGLYTKGRFSPKRESGVWHFQALYKKYLNHYLEEIK